MKTILNEFKKRRRLGKTIKKIAKVMAEFGVSKTFVKNMLDNGATTPEQYRLIRKQKQQNKKS